MRCSRPTPSRRSAIPKPWKWDPTSWCRVDWSQYTPARTLPLAEVKEQARVQRLLAQRGAELAKKEGADKLAAWKAAPDTAVLPAAGGDVARNNQQMPRRSSMRRLRLDVGALPAFGRGCGQSGLCRGQGH
jgi:hypothetical protein